MDGVAERLITHNAKLYESGVDSAVRLFARRTLTASLPAGSGMHSMSIHGNRYALGLSSQARDIGIAQDLSCDAGGPIPGSILGLAVDGDDAAILAIPPKSADAKPKKPSVARKAVEPASAEAKRKAAEAAERSAAVVSGVQASPLARDSLRRAVADARDGMPDRIDPAQKQVWFEAQGGEALVTPVVSLKVVGELSLALLADDGSERPSRIDLPVGGANPQNVGYVVGRTTRNGRRGAIPVMRIRCPAGRSTDASRMRARVLASGGPRPLLLVDLDAWNALRARADGNFDLPVHLAADAEDAAEFASGFLDAVGTLRSSGPWPADVVAEVASRAGADLDALRLVGALAGEVDVGGLSRRLATSAGHLASRRAARVGRDRSSGPPSERIHAALARAFAEGIASCLG